MENRQIRDNIFEIIFHLFNTIRTGILPLIAMVLVVIGENHKYTALFKMLIYSSIPVVILYSFLTWYFKKYVLTSKYISYSSGVIKRRNDEIPYDKIKSVNTDTSVARRILGLTKLTIEIIGGKNINFIVTKKEVEDLKEIIDKRMIRYIDEGPKLNTEERIKFNLMHYICMSLGDKKVFFGSFLVFLIILQVYFKFTQVDTTPDTSVIEMFEQTDISHGNLFMFIKGIAVSLSVFIIGAYVVSYIYIFITYSNFKIKKELNNTHVKYGLYANKEHYIPASEIRSIRLEEPLSYRIFGYTRVCVENIKEGEKKIIVHPIIKNENLPSFLKKYFEEYSNIEIKEFPVKESFKSFVLLAISPLILISIILSTYDPRCMYLMMLFPIFIMSGIYKWRYSGIGEDRSNIIISQVLFFERVITIVKKEYIQGITLKQNPFMKRSNTKHIRLELYLMSKNEVFYCKHIKNEYGDVLKEVFHENI